MATNLKLKKKCRVVPPEWLNVGESNTHLFDVYIQSFFVEYLQGRLLLETTRPEFSELPFRFAEIAKVLLDMCVPALSSLNRLINILTCFRASEDFQEPDKIRSLLKDIQEARQAKSREGLSKLDHSELSVRLPHICLLMPVLSHTTF